MTDTILDRYLTDLQGFISWWEQTHRVSFDVALVLDRDLRAWQRHRQREDGAKPATINRAQASLRAFSKVSTDDRSSKSWMAGSSGITSGNRKYTRSSGVGALPEEAGA